MRPCACGRPVAAQRGQEGFSSVRGLPGRVLSRGCLSSPDRYSGPLSTGACAPPPAKSKQSTTESFPLWGKCPEGDRGAAGGSAWRLGCPVLQGPLTEVVPFIRGFRSSAPAPYLRRSLALGAAQLGTGSVPPPEPRPGGCVARHRLVPRRSLALRDFLLKAVLSWSPSRPGASGVSARLWFLPLWWQFLVKGCHLRAVPPSPGPQISFLSLPLWGRWQRPLTPDADERGPRGRAI